ncbi:hypothetical protein [Methylorubrum extorquens]|uniref:Uncharacterized protein n=1 Tax=Methylorubrum extorquens (strain CM4 / NCIMB 13688) TaxID=440085 RepID=B7L1R2_METC4|nr:hypothetical protein [Methylorubrum extorquens]ACK81456.1 conserved hypothetical protein [Methylorubrum extorquens CM4]
MVRGDDQEGRKGTYGVLEQADVVWSVWLEDRHTPVVRVIRGRELTGPDLWHGVLKVENGLGSLDMAATWGDEIGPLDDGKTLDVPEPAVPTHLIDLVMSDPVLLWDGSELDLASMRERQLA